MTRRNESYIAAGAALVVVTCLFYPLLKGEVVGCHVIKRPPFGNQALSPTRGHHADVEMQMLPFLAFSVSELARGRIPLWNPYTGIGLPFLANQQSQAMHPIIWLAVLTGWRRGLTLAALFRILIAFIGTWLLARELRSSPWGATAAAVLYSAAPPLVARLTYPMGGVFAHAPLLAFLAMRSAKRRTARWTILLGVTLASSILTGHFEYLPVVWILTWIAYFAAGGRRRSLLRICFATGLGVALALPMLLPSLEYLSLSTGFTKRLQGKQPAKLSAQSVVVPSLPKGQGGFKLLPPLTRPAPPRSGADRPKPPSEPSHLQWISAVALIAVFSQALSRRIVGLGLLVGATMAFSYGAFPFVRRLPVLGWMVPSRLWILGVLGIALMVGMGLSQPADRKGRVLIGAVIGLSLFLFIGAVTHQGISIRSLGLALAAFLSILALPGNGWLPLRIAIVCALLLLECSFTWKGLICFSEPEVLFPSLPAVAKLKSMARHDRISGVEGVFSPNFGTAYLVRDVRTYDALGVSSAATQGGSTEPEWIRHFAIIPDLKPAELGPPSAARFILMPKRPFTSAWHHTGKPATVAVPLRSVVIQPISARGYLSSLSLFFDSPTRPPSPVYIAIRNSQRALFSTRLKPRWIPQHGWKRLSVTPAVSIDKDSLAIWVGVAQPPARTTLSLGGDHGFPRATDASGRLLPIRLAIRYQTQSLPARPSQQMNASFVAGEEEYLPRARISCHGGTVRFLLDEPTRIALKIETPVKTRLTLADLYFPGWQATLDGHEISIQRSGPYRKVPIPQGNHVLVFKYQPISYRVGLFVMCLGCLVIALHAGLRLPPVRIPESKIRTFNREAFQEVLSL